MYERHLKTSLHVSSSPDKLSRSLGLQYSLALLNKDKAVIMEQSATNKWFKFGEVFDVHTRGLCFSLSQVPDLECIIFCVVNNYCH